jgi:molecular chaperone GrpE (heat shock protein)
MTRQPVDWATRVRAAWAVLWNEGTPAERIPDDLSTRVAALELDLRDRDKEIRQLRREYELQREQTTRQQTEAASVGFEALARQLASPLSQLATMQVLADTEDRTVRSEDIFKLFDKVEQILAKSGLNRIGAVGAAVPFDTRLHQRISGVDLHDGDPVTIRFTGYRLGETILLKAMVSYRNDALETTTYEEDSRL